MEAVRKVARERITLSGITLPPLCQCGPSIWDSHPDTCANNCIFYKNPKGKLFFNSVLNIKILVIRCVHDHF